MEKYSSLNCDQSQNENVVSNYSKRRGQFSNAQTHSTNAIRLRFRKRIYRNGFKRERRTLNEIPIELHDYDTRNDHHITIWRWFHINHRRCNLSFYRKYILLE